MNTELEELARTLLTMPNDHKISGNSQGGYDCKCDARWDWQRSEKEAADLHVARYQAEYLMKVGYGKLSSD